MNSNSVKKSYELLSIKGFFLLILLLTYLFFCYLMFKIMWQYIYLDADTAFLRIKQTYVPMLHYRLAFFIHVFSSILVLPAGFTQFSKYIRRKAPELHRFSGWIYATIVIFIAGPSGFVIGIYANGGLSSQLAFTLLGFLWVLFTILAIFSIRRKKVKDHQAWMIRSFALAMSAITLRGWKYILVYIFHPRPMDVYMIIAWLGWVLNLMVAEIIIYKCIRK